MESANWTQAPLVGFQRIADRPELTLGWDEIMIRSLWFVFLEWTSPILGYAPVLTHTLDPLAGFGI